LLPEKQIGDERGDLNAWEIFVATFPISFSILVLVLTRVREVGLYEQLRADQAEKPEGTIQLGTFGTFSIDAALVIKLTNILDFQYTDADGEELGGIGWTYETLFLPGYVPFCMASVIVLYWHREVVYSSRGRDWKVFLEPLKTATRRIYAVAIPMVGALALVGLIREGTEGKAGFGSVGKYPSPAYIIGDNVSQALGKGWVALPALLGALGAFFSGSVTVSNLTFGAVQLTAAQNVGLNGNSMLALQACGAGLGNSICIANIITAKAIAYGNLKEGEKEPPDGEFVKRTALFCFTGCIIVQLVGIVVFFSADL
jgi:lactate permease